MKRQMQIMQPIQCNQIQAEIMYINYLNEFSN